MKCNVKKYCRIISNNGNLLCKRKENSSVKKTKQNRLMLLSNCADCGKKNFY